MTLGPPDGFVPLVRLQCACVEHPTRSNRNAARRELDQACTISPCARLCPVGKPPPILLSVDEQGPVLKVLGIEGSLEAVHACWAAEKANMHAGIGMSDGISDQGEARIAGEWGDVVQEEAESRHVALEVLKGVLEEQGLLVSPEGGHLP